MKTMFSGMGLQDYHAYWERRAERGEEEKYRRNLARASAKVEALQPTSTPYGPGPRETGDNPPTYAYNMGRLRELGLTPDFSQPYGLGGRRMLPISPAVTTSMREVEPEPLARGGLAMARRPYLVGEKGPELMVPDQPGRIIPNRALQNIARAVPRQRGGRVQVGGELDPYALGSPESYGGGRRTPLAVPPDTGERITAVSPEARVQELPGGVQSTGETGEYGGLGYDPTRPGFTNPIPVMRGTRVTYTGPGGEEHRTLQQANQAFNRALRPEAGAGVYEPPGAPLERLQQAGREKVAEIQAGVKGPLFEAQKGLAELEVAQKTGETHVATLNNYLETSHGGIVDNKVVFNPNKDPSMTYDAKAATEVAKRAGGPAAITHFKERQAIRNYLKRNPFQLPQGYDVNMYLGALSQNPEAWAEMVKEGQAKRLTPPQSPEDSLYVPTLLKRGAQRALSAGAMDIVP